MTVEDLVGLTLSSAENHGDEIHFTSTNGRRPS